MGSTCSSLYPANGDGLSACTPASPSTRPGPNHIAFVIERAAKSKVLAIEGPPKMKKLPPRVNEELRDLRIISLKRLGLTELPSGCLEASLDTLKTLRATNNNLKEIPPFFRDFRQLQTLDLSYNSLSFESLDFRIFPTSLVSLSLKANQLSSRIIELEHLVSLVELDISDNPNIMTLNYVNWSKLVSLEELNLDNLHLTNLPASLGTLTRLQVISARNNRLGPSSQCIPEAVLRNASSLHTLHLEGNEGLTDANFMQLPGAEEYQRRRKARLDKQLAGGTFSPDLAVI